MLPKIFVPKSGVAGPQKLLLGSHVKPGCTSFRLLAPAMPSYQARGALAVVAATLLAACVIFGQTGERVVLLTSGMEEFRCAAVPCSPAQPCRGDVSGLVPVA